MNKKQNKHYYLLPDGSVVENLKQGCERLRIGPQGFRALVRKEIVKKVNVPKTQGYETNRKRSK